MQELIQKRREFNLEIGMLFIDYEKLFDKVIHSK
jgi:hypothetical protein